ncbi:MAG: argininosuccinate lyase [Patescibacteria group bacterium]|nr:argininosuccinate lyase [Patescibacteria group bacterium]
MKLWNEYNLNEDVENFTVGDDHVLDQTLVSYDCISSMAHAKMLGKINVLTEGEVEKIVKEFQNILELNKKGEFKIEKEEEDCHTAIENHLTRHLGDLGKKIHTGRSRNDQVLTALRLYYKEEIKDCRSLTQEFMEEIKKFVIEYGQVQFPGYTHTRKAMPSSVALWGDSFVESMADNLKVLDLAFELINQSPSGTGAGYGVPLNIDREYIAKLLNFKKVQENPIYVQNSRGKFESTLLHALSQIMFDLNKLSSDLIFFTMPEFGYFEIPEEFCTGSSLMPQKRNPDVLELVRAKYHLVLSYEFQIKSLTSNLISGYHRDSQLTKDPVMKGFIVTKECLSIMSLVVKNLKANKEKCEQGLIPELYATNEVYLLVKKGVPFRQAYHEISKKYAKKK